MNHDWSRRLDSGETIEVPVRRGPRVFYPGGLVLFAAGGIYLAISSGHDPLTGFARVALMLCAGAVGSFAARALGLYYGIVTGRSKLTITQQGITRGDHHLAWTNIQDITLRPTPPVLRSLGIRTAFVRIQAYQRLRHIDITREHVKDLEVFTVWLQRTRSLAEESDSHSDR
ncbi:hypothetical protein OG474_22770 [Kribbella sp. NBC_01505]|uniref:hypothetical protein n=1 Tax=Kribbella sp. NBC_01505 TaxID=2903580 RepID=UPI0038686EAB